MVVKKLWNRQNFTTFKQTTNRQFNGQFEWSKTHHNKFEFTTARLNTFDSWFINVSYGTRARNQMALMTDDFLNWVLNWSLDC